MNIACAAWRKALCLSAGLLMISGCTDDHLVGLGPQTSDDGGSSPGDGSADTTSDAVADSPSDVVADTTSDAIAGTTSDAVAGTELELFEVELSMTADAPPVRPEGGYRLSGVTLRLADPFRNLAFEGVMNRFFAATLAIAPPGPPPLLSIEELDLLFNWEWRQDGRGRFTVCQGEPRGDGAYGCRTDSAPVIGETSYLDTSAITFSQIEAVVLRVLHQADTPLATPSRITLTLHVLELMDARQPDATTGQLVSQIRLVLAVPELCATHLRHPGVVAGCDRAEVNLLDSADGPDESCGQDNSAGVVGPDPACTPAFSDPHTPPMHDLQGHPPPDGYSMQGFLQLTPVKIVP